MVQIIVSSSAKALSKLPPECFDALGYVSFELPESFELNETITPNSKVAGNQALFDNFIITSNILLTPRNLAIFQHFDKEIPVIVKNNDAILPYDTLIAKKETGGYLDSYECEFVSINPLVKIKDIKLSELDLGEFTLSATAILENFKNAATNDDTHALCLVNYGKWQDTHEPLTEPRVAKVRDLRIWVKERAVMSALFKKVGYSLDSPFHQTKFGKKCINYLLGDFRKDNIDQFGFKLVCTQGERHNAYIDDGKQVLFTNLVFENNARVIEKYMVSGVEKTVDQQGFDKGLGLGYYNNSALRNFTNLSGRYFFKIDLYFKSLFAYLPPLAVDDYKAAIFFRIRRGGQLFATFRDFPLTEISNGVSYGQFYVLPFEANALEQFTFEMGFRNGVGLDGLLFDLEILRGSTIELIQMEKWLSLGLNEPVAKYLDGKIRGFDYFFGVAHAQNAHYAVDYGNAQFSLSPPYSIKNLFGSGEDVKGYYNFEQVEFAPYQVENSLQIDNTLKIEQEKKTRIAYKDGNDSFIDSSFERTNPTTADIEKAKLFAYVHTLNDDNLEDKEKTDLNPFFSPTLTHNRNSLSTSPIPIAQCLSNNDGTLSYDIGFRRCFIESKLGDAFSKTEKLWTFERPEFDTIGYFPTCMMEHTVQYNGTIPVETLSYAFWGKQTFAGLLDKEYFNGRFIILAHIPLPVYMTLDLRQLFLIYHAGFFKHVRINEINEYPFTSAKSVVVKGYVE